MTETQLTSIAAADLIAAAWFLLCWYGYNLLADREHGRPSLQRSMHAYRQLWMAHMLERDNRIVDSQIIGNLMSSASFFASTTVLILAGLIAVLGARPAAMAVLSELPFRRRPLTAVVGPQGPAADRPVRLRVLQVHLGVPTVQLLPDTARQHTSARPVTEESRRIAERTAIIATSTARHFNRGTRAYYFGLAALAWFVHPWLFVLATVWVILVLYRREFRSRLLATLGAPEDGPAGRPSP
jgi:uncharacterized membrane protein